MAITAACSERSTRCIWRAIVMAKPTITSANSANTVSHTTSLNLRVYGQRDLENHLAQLRADWPTYDIGVPRQVSE